MLTLINALYLQASEPITESPVFSGGPRCTPLSVCWCSGPRLLSPVLRRVVAREPGTGGAQGLCVRVGEVAAGRGDGFIRNSQGVEPWRGMI